MSLLLAAGLAWVSHLTHQREYAKAEISAKETATCYALLIEHLLTDIELAIRQVTANYLNPNETQSLSLTGHLLNQRKPANPLIMDWLILDAAGNTVMSSTEHQIPDAKLKAYYLHHLNNPNSSTYLTPPEVSHLYGQEWYFSLSRAVRDQAGNLQAVGVALISIDHLGQYFTQKISGQGLAITLIHQQGRLLLRAPPTSHSIGHDISSLPKVDFPIQQPQIREIPKGLDEARRIVSLHPLQDFNLVVVGSKEMEDALATWHAANVKAAITWLIVTALGIALTYQIIRASRKEEMQRLQREHYLIEQARLSEALRTSEQTFRMFVENASDIIFSLDQQGNLTYVSPNAASILGYRTKELIGTNIKEYVHPRDLPHCLDYLQRALLCSESLESIEYQILHCNGEWRWHAVKGRRMTDSTGETQGFLGISRDIQDKKEAELKLLRLAHYDPLTELPNRALFFDMVKHALESTKRQGGQLALLFVDLDHFKPVNDQLGHAAGDRLLQLVAKRLEDCIRASDAVGRVGGDEFVVLLHRVKTAKETRNVAEKIRTSISAPYDLDGNKAKISCSIGIAIFPRDGQDMAELSRLADRAMYCAKQAGKNCIKTA